MSQRYTNSVTWTGLLIALGVVYGDIGTSPLYTFKAIIGNNLLSEELILGGLSCIFWTLTLQTTVKYIWLTLNADNNGEGGIFSLYALVRRSSKYVIFPAMIGGMALLADGIMTPAVTITSAIEGLNAIPGVDIKNQVAIIFLVIIIISALFLSQQFGTEKIGRFFGPFMFLWFLILALFGLPKIIQNPNVFRAFNPYYCYQLLTNHTTSGLAILGAIFLCTTGAEALYSDLGHCGKKHIRISWIYVKSCLIINYLGQGAYVLQLNGPYFNPHLDVNPFFAIIPSWFLWFSVIIATIASIIASQALISGSFSMIREAISLNLWPKLKIIYPSLHRGQLYIPTINTLLYLGCLAVVFIFRSSANMESAYGLTISIGMLMTSYLFVVYMYNKDVSPFIIACYIVVYGLIESSFFFANMLKFFHGAYVIFLIALLFVIISYVRYNARRIKRRFIENININKYLHEIIRLSNDLSIPKYSTHLIYMNSAQKNYYVEHQILYSLFAKIPKRADVYWFVNLRIVDDPTTCEYMVHPLVPQKIYRINLFLGFQVPIRVDQFVRKVIWECIKKDEIKIDPGYEYLVTNSEMGDYKFVVMEEILSFDNNLALYEKIIIQLNLLIKKIWGGDKNFGIDSSSISFEKYPIIWDQKLHVELSERESRK